MSVRSFFFVVGILAASVGCSRPVDFSRGVIVVDPSAARPDVFAAEELQLHLERCLGRKLPIVPQRKADSPAFEIATERARRMARGAADFADEECAYRVAGDAVYLAGGGARGATYAVYEFLERELGVRWYGTCGETLAPKRSSLSLADGLTRLPAPAFTRRCLIGPDTHPHSRPEAILFLYRNRINVSSSNFDTSASPRKDLAGKLVPAEVFKHPIIESLFTYVPPEDRNGARGRFAEHPDWFTWDARKKRRVTNRQLCFSNPDLRAELTRAFLANVKAKGGAGFFDLSALDVVGAFCDCADCQAAVRRTGAEGGVFFEYVAELSKKLAKDYPEAKIHFLAYRKEQSQFPPTNGLCFAANVVPVFAPIQDDVSKDFRHANNCKSFDALRDWCRIAPGTWLWYYPEPYDCFCKTPENPPTLSLRRFATDSRLAFEAGLRGASYEQDVGTAAGVNFADLTTWVLAQLYRDPTADAFALAREFCAFHYGAAGADMMTFAEELSRSMDEYPVFLVWRGRNNDILTDANLVRWNRLFDRMEQAVAADPPRLQHVREARVGLEIATLEHYRSIVRDNPGVLPSAETFAKRVRTTVDAALARRYTGEKDESKRRAFARSLIKAIDERSELALHEPKPLPADLVVPHGAHVIQAFPKHGKSGTIIEVAHSDAALGYAVHDTAWTAEDHRTRPCPFGLTDDLNHRHILSRNIEKSEVATGRFKLYKLGRITLPSRDCLFWVGPDTRIQVRLGTYFTPGETPAYDLYASLKFEGPDHPDCWLDRVVLVGPLD